MAGGIGSRFWPISRTDFPKQFLDILNTGRTLIQATFDRFAKFVPVENIYIITFEQYQDLVAKQLPELPVENILCEPSRKNTAPCVAYISYKLQQLNANANLICAPADHIITDEAAFEKVCKDALHFTSHIKGLVTLGIKPTHPNTGYGYIQYEPHAVSRSSLFTLNGSRASSEPTENASGLAAGRYRVGSSDVECPEVRYV